MAMRKQAGLFVLVVALLLPLAASAAPAHHDSFDVTGTVFPCPTHTYTITSGTLKIVTHTTEAASGNTHFTATTTPNHVSLVDEDGTVYSLSGAIWFAGDSEEELLTAIHMLNIVGPGGVSDSFRLVERFRFGELITFDFGSCELP
jgi:hypothetical protein